MGRRSKEIPQGDRLRDEAILVIENPATVPFRSLVPIGSNCDFVIVILSLFFLVGGTVRNRSLPLDPAAGLWHGIGG